MRLSIAGYIDLADGPRLPLENLKRYVDRVAADRLLWHHPRVEITLLVVGEACHVGQFQTRAAVDHPSFEFQLLDQFVGAENGIAVPGHGAEPIALPLVDLDIDE